MSEIRLPLGLCEIKYGDNLFSHFADQIVFEAIPKYQTMRCGVFEKRYMLEEYDVSVSLAFQSETYQTLKLAYPSLQEVEQYFALSTTFSGTYTSGMYDNPLKVNTEGKPLIIHPVEAGESRAYDITIFNAIIDPNNPLRRVYGKNLDSIGVRFIGQPGRKIDENSNFKSYFYIGALPDEEVI